MTTPEKANINAAVRELATALGLKVLARNESASSVGGSDIDIEWHLADSDGKQQHYVKLSCGSGWGVNTQGGWGAGAEWFENAPKQLVVRASTRLLCPSEKICGAAAKKLARQRFCQWAKAKSDGLTAARGTLAAALEHAAA